jgi:hypothetical protein
LNAEQARHLAEEEAGEGGLRKKEVVFSTQKDKDKSGQWY